MALICTSWYIIFDGNQLECARTRRKRERDTAAVKKKKKKKNEVMEVLLPNSWSYFSAIFPRAVIFLVK